jgi:hypothetical protein
MIKDLPNGLTSALLEGLSYTLSQKFASDGYEVNFTTANPTIINPSDGKATAYIIAKELPVKNNQVHKESFFPRSWEFTIEIRGAIHNTDSPYYIAHNLREYLKNYLETTIREDGITGTFLGVKLESAFQEFELSQTPSIATCQEGQNGYAIAQAIYSFRWTELVT